MYCYAEFNFALRSADPLSISDAISQFDIMMVDQIKTLIGNACLSPESLIRASLPVSLSGLGIPLAKNCAPSAYLGSKFQSFDLQLQLLQVSDLGKDLKMDLDCLFSDFISAFMISSEMLTFNMLLSSKNPQHLLSSFIYKNILSELESSPISSRREKSLIKAGQQGSEWLSVVPNISLLTSELLLSYD